MLASFLRTVAAGMAAGAAGTTALNAVTYLDMALRGRPASSTPERSVEVLARKSGIGIPGRRDKRKNRIAGLGPLMGLATGVAVGAGYGALHALGWRPSVPVGGLAIGAIAMAGSSAPMTALRVTDPRAWGVEGWASDAVPHLVYGLVTAATYSATER